MQEKWGGNEEEKRPLPKDLFTPGEQENIERIEKLKELLDYYEEIGNREAAEYLLNQIDGLQEMTIKDGIEYREKNN